MVRVLIGQDQGGQLSLHMVVVNGDGVRILFIIIIDRVQDHCLQLVQIIIFSVHGLGTDHGQAQIRMESGSIDLGICLYDAAGREQEGSCQGRSQSSASSLAHSPAPQITVL